MIILPLLKIFFVFFFFFFFLRVVVLLQITEKVGPGIPVITNKAKGLIGTDVQTDKLREVCSLICLS